ncbi:MAG: VOC family protein [Alphaproteobacteria bacterium]|nr:VOC family protein [Alphaproteobacteria bacterium]MCB9791558.1 VOC family protein [Alphaproteobacteria bacterium]
MKPPPPGWTRINPSVHYQDALAAIHFLCEAFGFERVLVVEGEGGRVEHSELSFADDGLIMVGTEGGNSERDTPLPVASPRSLGGRSTTTLCLFVDDVDAHCARAEAAGAQILQRPKTSDYGEDYWADRSYGALDPEGHLWWFMQRVRGPGA